MRRFRHRVLIKASKALVILLFLGGLIFFSDNGIILAVRFKIINFFSPISKINWRWWESDQSQLLKEKEERIKTLRFELENLSKENLSLKAALDFKTKSRFSFLKNSKVIFYSKDMGREFLIVDKGEKEGVSNGNLVLSDQGRLVGVVQEANENFSKIDMAYNPGRSFEAEITSLGLRALAEGAGNREWHLKLIPSGTELKKGDFVSLVGGQLKSVFLGEISEVGKSDVFVESKARTLLRPELLDNVFVITNPLK